MAIAKFDNAELNQETLTSQLEAMSQRVNALAPPSSGMNNFFLLNYIITKYKK